MPPLLLRRCRCLFLRQIHRTRASLPAPPPRVSSPWSPPLPPTRRLRWIFPSTHPGLASGDVERDINEVGLPSPPPHPSMGLAQLPADRDGCDAENDRQLPLVRFDQRMVVFAETKLQRDGIELSTGFRVIKDRRTNPSYLQHASLVYTLVPTKKILYAPGGAGGVRGSQLQWRRTRSTRRASWIYHNISKCYNKEKKRKDV